MATTLNEERSHSSGGIKHHHIKLTAGAADTTATYTFAAPFPILLGCSAPIKTTGTQAGVGIAYVESTGVITVGPLANNDVVRFTVIY